MTERIKPVRPAVRAIVARVMKARRVRAAVRAQALRTLSHSVRLARLSEPTRGRADRWRAVQAAMALAAVARKPSTSTRERRAYYDRRNGANWWFRLGKTNKAEGSGEPPIPVEDGRDALVGVAVES